MELTYGLHASLPAGCISCPVSCLCVAGGVGKCRALVDLSPSDLKQRLVRGQPWSLALWQGEAERSPAPARPPSCIMASPFSAPATGCCLCRAPAQQHAKALLLPLLVFYFLLLYFHLGRRGRAGVGAELRLAVWLPLPAPGWLRGRGEAVQGQRQQEGGSRCEDVGTRGQGRTPGRAGLVQLRISAPAVAAPFPTVSAMTSADGESSVR